VTPPIEVSLVRGPHVESRHLVHAAVCDADGREVRSWGDADRLTHPRSAVKPMQALPLVEATAAADGAAAWETAAPPSAPPTTWVVSLP